jgi:Recombination endonuclease VII
LPYKNKKKRLAVAQRWRDRHPEQARLSSERARLKKVYGLSLEERDALFENGCWICGSLENLHIDHDHKTGKIRGCLCERHNLSLGLFHDSTNELRKAIQYLEASNGVVE